MRFGYCANLNFYLNGDDTSRKVFDAVLAAGFDYIEMPLSALLHLSAPQRKELDSRLADSGIPCRANFLLFPHELPLVGDALNLNDIAEHAKKVLPIAKEIGSELVVFGNGGSRRVREGLDRAAVRAQMLDILTAVAPIAQEYQVKVAVEPLCSKETNMINSYKEGAALARDARSEWIGSVCDWYHVATDGQNPAEILDATDKLFHLHIANPQGRLIPSRRDDQALYAPFIDAVKKSGYDGKLSIEVGSPGDPDKIADTVKEGLAALRAFFS